MTELGRRLAVVAALAIPALAGCVAAARPARPAAIDVERLRCEAVARALDSLVMRRPGMRLAVIDSTKRVHRERLLPGTWDQYRQTPGLDSTTWNSFVAANQARQPACETLPGEEAIMLVSDSVWQAVRDATVDSLPGAYWRGIYARFPQAAGLSSTSGVGLSADHRQAFMVVTHGCGDLCGHGHVVLLERDPGGPWRVRYARMLWVS